MFPVSTSTLPNPSSASRDDRIKYTSLGNLLLDGQCTALGGSALLFAAASKDMKDTTEGQTLSCPVGFEQKLQLQSMRVFYVDHISRSTAWSDPRARSDAPDQGMDAGEVEAELQQLCSAVLPEQVRPNSPCHVCCTSPRLPRPPRPPRPPHASSRLQ